MRRKHVVDAEPVQHVRGPIPRMRGKHCLLLMTFASESGSFLRTREAASCSALVTGLRVHPADAGSIS